MKKIKAFTLIELLVVIVIIGILAALIVLSLTSARSKARDARAKSAVSDTATAVEMYINDNESTTAYPTSGTALVGTGAGGSSIGTYLKSNATDANGDAISYKITSPTQYGVVGKAADGGCWYTSSGITGRTNNLSQAKSTVSTNPACSISTY